MTVDTSIFWDINRTLSYNCLFNFIVGIRGTGKTYGFKKWAIASFLKTGAEFIYVRRFSKELNKIATFFNDVSKDFPGHEFKVKGTEFFIDGKYCGRGIILATAKIEKSVSFPNVDKICFDEFILDSGYHHYLPDEITAFLELYETIARMRDVRMFFLSNAITIANPYFIYFNISLPYGKTISRTDDILIELVQPKAFIDAKKKTRFARIVKGTPYESYAIENQFLRDSKTFLGHKTAAAELNFNFVYDNITYGYWIDYSLPMGFVSMNTNTENYRTYAFQDKDHKPNLLLLKGSVGNTQVKRFMEMYKMGLVRFESQAIKKTCENILRMAL